MFKQFSKRQQPVRRLWRMSWKDEQQWRISRRDSESLVHHHWRDPTMFSNWGNGYVNRVLARVKLGHLKPHQLLSPLRHTPLQTTLAIPLEKPLLLVFLVKRSLNFGTSKINFFKILEVGSNALWRTSSGVCCEPNWNSYVHYLHHAKIPFLSTTSLGFSTVVLHLLDLPSQLLSLPRLLTSPPSLSMRSTTPTFKPHGNCDKRMPQKRLLTLSLISYNSNHSLIQFHVPYGEILFRTNMLTSKNFMHQWIEAIVIKMKPKILLGAMHWSERISTLRKSQLSKKPSGLGFLPLGNLVSLFSSLTVNKTFRAIARWLLTSFEQLRSILVLPSNLIWKLKTVTHEIHIAWMTAADFIFVSSRECFESVKWLITLSILPPNVQQYHAKTGIMEYVLTHVSIGAGMASVVNVEGDIKHEKRNCATLLSKLTAEKDIALATQRAETAAQEGPRTLPSAAKHTN